MSHVRNGDEGPVLVSESPATGEILGETPLLDTDAVSAAVARASAAFPLWAELPLKERILLLSRGNDILLKRCEEVAALISAETGKPRQEALVSEVMVALDLLKTYCERAPLVLADQSVDLHHPLLRMSKSSRIAHRPLGVVSVISPWNYPFAIAWSGIVFALLGGNTVVFKPASDGAMTGMLLTEILQKAGLPEGVLNCVVSTPSQMKDHLFSPPVAKVVFTGSTTVGAEIYAKAASHWIPVVMELGGKDPMIVCEDADLALAAHAGVWGAFSNAGQVCASVERIYVAQQRYSEFVKLLVDKTKALRLGEDKDHELDLGPLISQKQLDLVDALVAQAQQQGARALTGGKRLGKKGHFYEPTILVDVDHNMDIMKEEIFGPVVCVMPVADDQEALGLANDSIYGLTASIFTKDMARFERLAKNIQAGTVMHNDVVYTYGLCETPWQGMKASGIGRSHADAGLLEYVYPQHLNWDRSLPFQKRRLWWFPYSKVGYETQLLAAKALTKMRNIPKFLWEITRKLRKALR